MQAHIDITGLGLVSPLGSDSWATIAALLKGRTIADRLKDVPDQMDPTTLAMAVGGAGRARFAAGDPAVDLAERAAREALFEAGLDRPETPVRTIIASSKGAVLSMLEHTLTHTAAGRVPHHEAAAFGPHAWLADQLTDRLPLGMTTSIVAACATSMTALNQARREILEGREDRVLVVAVEAAMHPVFVETYRRLGVLAPTDPPAEYVARPLDQGRSGFTLNEIAAAVLLERHDPDRTPDARLVDVRIGTQTTDLVRPADDQAVLRGLLQSMAIQNADLTAIHPHAPGTSADEAEIRAIASVAGESETPLYAVKGALGHALGASGLVSVVVAARAGRAGRIPPMPWLHQPLSTPLSIRPGGVEIGPGLHLAVSAGFGGHVGAALLDVR